MADNPTLTNKKTSFDADTNADIPVRATDRAGFQTQHLRVDVGDAAESLLKVGQQAMTASVPVVLASDQTVIPVSDNSGSLTVDGTVAVSAVGGTVAISAASLPLPTGAATAALQLPDGHNVTVDNAAGAAAVNIQDGGNSITVDGAVTVSGTVSVTEPVSVDDNGTTLSVDDGAGSLTVDGTVAATQSGTWNIGTVTTVTTLTNITNQGQLVDNAAFTDGTTRLNMAGFIFDEVAGTALTENDGAAARIDSKRALIGVIEDATTRGQRATVTAANALKVDGSAVTQPVSGTVTANQGGTWNITNVSGTVSLPTGAATSANQSTEITALQLIDDIVLAEDAAHASGAAGVLALTRRADTASTSAGTDGDYATLNTNGDGRLHVADTRTGTSAQEVQGVQTSGAALTGKIFPTGQVEFFSSTVIPPHCISSGGVNYQLSLNPDLGLGFIDYSPTGEVYVNSNIAHDAADSQNPIKIGFRASSYAPATSDQPSANRTAVASADKTDASANLYGELVEGVNPYFFTLDNVSTTYNNTTTTATSTAKNCWNYREACIAFEITKANSPTDITFEVEVSLDGTNYAIQVNAGLGSWVYSSAAVGSGIKRAYVFPIAAQKIRLKVTATGTTASATFTVANAKLYLRN